MAGSTTLDTREGQPEIPADLHDIALCIHEMFDDRLDPRQVDETLVTVAATFADARIRSFVPLLVRRYVTEDLHARLRHA